MGKSARMAKCKKTRAKPTAKKSVSVPSQASTNGDRFVEKQLLLCEWQDKLELSLFVFCQRFCPETIEKRKWTCYQAAELPALTEAIIRYCHDHKDAIANTGITPEERDDFLLDLQVSRVIRNAAVHRVPVLDVTLARLGDCAYRILSMVKRVVNCSDDSEIGEIQRWMATQGWATNDLSSTSALLLSRHVESGCQQVAQSAMMKATEKECNRKRNEEQRKTGVERRKQRQERQDHSQATAQLRREKRQMRALEQILWAEKRKAERERRFQDQESLRAHKAAQCGLQPAHAGTEMREAPGDLALPQRTTQSSSLFAIWEWMC